MVPSRGRLQKENRKEAWKQYLKEEKASPLTHRARQLIRDIITADCTCRASTGTHTYGPCDVCRAMDTLSSADADNYNTRPAWGKVE